MVFCTLFDSNYLDKGLVMYRSIKKHAPEARVYFLAMDDKCEEVLTSYSNQNQAVINLDVFTLKMDLKKIREERPRVEFYWTCTSYLIDYVLTVYGEKECTYVDADLRFYCNPQCLLDEMQEKSVQIVPHGFDNSLMGRYNRALSGTYCVQFNTFRNEESSLYLLRWWEKKCYESCSNISMEKTGIFGDQGYLESWGSKDNVNVLKNPGGGVAPWNAYQYEFVKQDSENEGIMLKKRKQNGMFPLVFYHFHNINYYSSRKVDICAYDYGKVDYEIIRNIYIPYLKELDAAKEELKEKFGIYPLLTSHPGKAKHKRKKTVQDYLILFNKTLPLKLYFKTIGTIRIINRSKKNIVEFEAD